MINQRLQRPDIFGVECSRGPALPGAAARATDRTIAHWRASPRSSGTPQARKRAGRRCGTAALSGTLGNAMVMGCVGSQLPREREFAMFR